MDRLVARGFRCLTVLDISATAMRRAQERLRDAGVRWLEADVTGDWTAPPVHIWHDRAVFHFLTDPADRAAYVRHLHETLAPGGHAIVATFAPDGPDRCSGLPVQRYTAETLASELGPEFGLVESLHERHRTPGGAVQPFFFGRFKRRTVS